VAGTRKLADEVVVGDQRESRPARCLRAVRTLRRRSIPRMDGWTGAVPG
jgi:hypothetical protein